MHEILKLWTTVSQKNLSESSYMSYVIVTWKLDLLCRIEFHEKFKIFDKLCDINLNTL